MEYGRKGHLTSSDLLACEPGTRTEAHPPLHAHARACANAHTQAHAYHIHITKKRSSIIVNSGDLIKQNSLLLG